MRRNSYPDELWVAANQNIKAKNFWLKQLSGDMVKSHFPYDHDGHGKSSTVNTLTFQFTGELFSKLKKISANSDIKLHMILTAALIVLLQKYTDNNDIIIGTSIYKQEIEGEFINTVLSLRTQVHRDMTFKEFLPQFKQTIMEALENYNYPIEILVEQLNLQTSEEDFPLFDMAVLLENIQDKNHINHIPLKMIFSFIKIEAETCIQGVVKYNSLFYRETTIERIINHLNRLINHVLFHAHAPFKEVDILSTDEKKQLLIDFNRTGVEDDYPAHSVQKANKTVMQLFEQQVQKTPGRKAIVFNKEVLTYKQLNDRVNRAAWYLRKKGVTSDTIVGTMMEHSLEMLIAVLAVWKAGAAYLPIGADYPQKRVISMLNDSQALIFLTEEKILKKLSFTPLQSFQSTAPGLFITPSRSQVEDINALQMPDRSLVNYEKYRPYIGQAVAKNSITVQFSRGCVYNCAFCFKVWPHKYIVRSAENLFQEIQTYYNMGIRRFAFVDDLPNLNIKNSSRFYELIIKHGMKVHFHFPNGIRGDILTKDHIDLMVEAGTVNMDLALETTSPRLQKLIRKRLNLEKLDENIHYIIEKHPQVILELQIIHGLPTETEEEAMASLDYIKNLEWVHFPYIHILNIYPNSAMAEIAMQHGISKEAIQRSADIAYHELPETLPFPKHFTKKYQSEFVSQYFMSKERLLAVLPYQMQVLTEDELVQKYNSYLPVDIHTFSDLLNYAGISRQEISSDFLPRDFGVVPDFNEKLKKHFAKNEPAKDALRLLLLDLSQYFSHETRIIYDVVEPPLGLMYLLTHLQREFPGQIHGKIAKSRIDFDNYDELKLLIREFKPQVIGIRSLNFYKEFFHQTISLIRQWRISVPIIAGGPYATSSYAAMMQDHHIDLAVLGEGEITFAQLIGKILENNHQLPPEETLKNIPGLAFIQQKEKSLLKKNNREIVIMDQLSETLLQESVQNPGNVNNPSDLAYIIYTSGSTGTPKGVMIRHDNLFHQITGLQKRFKFDAHLNYLLLAAFTFDVSVMHICLPLTSGAKLFLIDELTRKDPLKLWQFIYDNKIDILNIVPAFMKALLENLEKQKFQFKYLFVGGDLFRAELYHALKETFKAEKIINIYGPTETTINATLYECQGKNTQDIIPIGKPLPHYKVYILDSHLSLLPPGAAGELCISGYSLARGYLNRPELTEEKFIPNPCTLYRSNKSYMSYIYRTGDLVRWRPDGNIQFLGRIDQQVKIRGFRIELGEIEKKLKNHNDIKDAVVIARQDKEGDKYLSAYIAPHQRVQDQGSLVPELKEYLSRELPDYMVPPYFVRLGKIPLNVNGKVDKKALPTPERTNRSVYTPPRNQLEKTLVELWSNVIGIESTGIGIDTNFFELGGHSLKATILISKIHKELEVKVPLVELFRTPFIRGLAEYIKSLKKDRFISITPVEKKEYYPLSSAQKRLYFLQQMSKNSTGYNLSLVLSLGKGIQINHLESLLKKLIARHQSLRTSFIMVSEQPMQKIHPFNEVEFKTRYYDTDKEGEPVSGIIKNFIRPFDLTRAPLIRSGIIKLPDGNRAWIVDIHHIVSDGTSHNILSEDFLSLYRGKKLNPLRIQYKDFSHWQNRLFQSDFIKVQQDYWLKLYPDRKEIPRLEIGEDFKRPEIFTFAGHQYRFSLEPGDTIKFKALNNLHGGTLFMSILTVLDTLFYKYTGQTDIIIGTVIAGRRHADLQDIIGMFVNTLSMRGHPHGDKTYRSLLKEVIESSIKAFENQDIQFETLVEKLDLERDLSRNPLFDITMAIQNFTPAAQELKEIDEKPIPLELSDTPKTSKFDMTFLISETDDHIHITIEYYTGIFKQERIQRLAAHFQEVIRAVLIDPSIKLKDIDILTAEEKHQLLHTFNGSTGSYPRNQSIHQLFVEQVDKTPDQVALLGKDEEGGEIQLSYRELNKQTNQLANRLKQKNLQPDTIVGLMMERSIRMIIGILGILKAGGAYMPIDPGYPGKRISYMLADSGTNLLVISDTLFEDSMIERWEGETVFLSTAPGNSPLERDDPKDRGATCQASPGNLAYIIYTSGTTGSPKGSLVQHRNVVALMLHHDCLFDFNSNDIWTLFHSYCFDFSVWEMYGALLYGGKLIIIPKMTARSPQKYLEILKAGNVTVLNQTPVVFYQLAQQEIENPGENLRLRYVIFGGEALTLAKLKSWQEKYPETKLINMYGITETTVHVTYKEINDNDIRLNISNIGTPLPTLNTYVMDRHQKLMPIGIPGELCVSGEGVCRGYLNRPGLTAEKFSGINIKVEKKQTSRNYRTPLYRSGDLGKFNNLGELQYLGRIDHQVKIRGYRVELGEIENQLLKHEKIKETTVIPIRKNEYLCAYLVAANPEEKINTPKLKEYLAIHLPTYMIPSYFIQLEKIPLTPAGKLDRKALPPPGPHPGNQYTAPRNKNEKQLVAIWQETLGSQGHTPIGIDDNFFDLGGHSLKATVLATKIHKVSGVKIPLAEIFKTPTIRGLAHYLSSTKQGTYILIDPAEKTTHYPLSALQKGLYILDQVKKAGTAYNLSMVMTVKGRLKKTHLENTFLRLLQHHESLRTSFERVKTDVVQRVHRDIPFEIEFFDLKIVRVDPGIDIQQRQKQLLEKTIHDFIRPFDLGQAPLLRIGIIKLTAEKHLLLFDIHHIISDGTSLGILIRDVVSLYEGKKISPLRLQYKDFSRWQNSSRGQSIIKQQETYWLNLFKGKIPQLSLYTDWERPAVQSFEGKETNFVLQKKIKEQIRQLNRNTGTTLYMLLLAVFNILLNKYSGQEDIVVGTPIAGREHTDFENIIGLFINALPMRNFPTAKKTFLQFLNEVKENTLQAYQNQQYPFNYLVEKLGLLKDVSRNPLFDVELAVQNIETSELKIKGLRFIPYESSQQKKSQVDITLNIMEADEAIHINVLYCTTLFRPETIQRLIASFKKILITVLGKKHIQLKDIHIVHDFQKVKSTSYQEKSTDFRF